MRKQNNVYGVVGIRAIDANWNAGFDGLPKSLPDGTIFGSDKALKYAIRKYWQLQGLPVLYVKTRKTIDGKLSDCTLEERYATLFKKKVSEIKDKTEILKYILSAIDARQFGFTFAVKGNNLNGTGPVQIGIGRNIYNNSQINYQDILSPFVADKGDGENSDKSTIGEFVTVDRVNYAYPFCINPKTLEYDGLGDELGSYTEEDYDNFLKAAAVCANAISSCTKAGAQNEYVITIETNDNSLYLNNIAEYVDMIDNQLVLDRMMKYLASFMDRIKSIKVYYDDSTISINDYENLEKLSLSELQ